jgi:hypothetical protein
VYIDARHDEEGVMEDLAAWWPKVRCGGPGCCREASRSTRARPAASPLRRPGGVFAGHDYLDGTIDVAGTPTVFGVKTAVTNFFAAKARTYETTEEDGAWKSWYLVK